MPITLSDEAKQLLLTACRMPHVRDEVVVALEAALAAEPSSLQNGKIWIGNASEVPTELALSGEATMANTGVVTLSTTGVTGKVLTGFSAGAGTVAGTDTILQAVNKLAGNTQNLTVINNVLTGYSAGTQGSVTALAATDSILQGIQKLDGNKPSYTETTFAATFGEGVGEKTVVVRKLGKQVTLEIPTGSTADGGGVVLASGATDITAGLRPAADLSFPCVVTDNGVVVAGTLTVTAAGQLSFGVGAASAAFTDDAAAGFKRISVTYSVA